MLQYIIDKIKQVEAHSGRNPNYILVRSSDWFWFISELNASKLPSFWCEQNTTYIKLYGCLVLKVENLTVPIEVI
jgi:hypothetical protein